MPREYITRHFRCSPTSMNRPQARNTYQNCYSSEDAEKLKGKARLKWDMREASAGDKHSKALERHKRARSEHECVECGARAGESCKQLYNRPLGKPLSEPWGHESRLEDELVQHMRKAAL